VTRRRQSFGWLVAFTAFCVAAPAARVDAHHSFAMYDQTTTKTMSGTLVRLIPGGSHSQIVFDVMDDTGKPTMGPDGKPLKWQVELGSQTNISRQGVTPKTVPPGTVITITFFAQRNGARQGAIAGPLVLCGTALPAGGCNAQTGTVMKPPAN
jgi:hypothetical protein